MLSAITTLLSNQNAIDYDNNDNDKWFARGDVVPYEGQLKMFRSFMLRANRYGMLLGGGSGGGGKMVLIDEIPSFARRDPAEFREEVSFNGALIVYSNNFSLYFHFCLTKK